MATFWGVTSWYQTCNLSSSGTPNGACGTCYRDRPGVAYPHLANHGTDWALLCGLDMIPQLSCGTNITVTDQDCSTNSITIPVVDKGPNLPALDCPDNNYHCSLTRSPRVIDLTRQSFIDIGADPTWGLLGIKVDTP